MLIRHENKCLRKDKRACNIIVSRNQLHNVGMRKKIKDRAADKNDDVCLVVKPIEPITHVHIML